MTNKKILNAKKRIKRVRAKVSGTKDRPRLVVRKSHYALIAQLVNDENGTTISSIRVIGKNIEAGKKIGTEIAKVAINKKIKTVVYDKGANKYHGVIASIADAAREGGLKF